METVLPTEFKRMMVLMLEGAPYVIEDSHQSGTAQTKHKLHTRLRHLKTGHIIDRVFAENERVPVAHLETRRVSYSYSQTDLHVFLDAATFDELDLNDERLGERRWFLKENEEYKAMFLDGALLDIVLPPQVPLQVLETAPPVRGGSDTAWKPAKLETGLEIMVPLFIAKGETIRVDTASKKYAGKQLHEKDQ
jgi:elongation factor P